MTLVVGCASTHSALVFQSDFGLKDGAVAAMHGVSRSIEPNLGIFNLTHEIPAFSVWEASYRLWQTAPYWPEGTVFVSVVDPGVGTDRKSVVAEAGGRFFVTPDNGSLSHLERHIAVTAVREIDEARHRRPGSEHSHTFHGRDVYAYTGALLASGQIRFEDVGPVLRPETLQTMRLPEVRPEADAIVGAVEILDPQYGNVWTNITREDLQALNAQPGDTLLVSFRMRATPLPETWQAVKIPLTRTFADVPEGTELAYWNSLERLAFAVNQGDFAERHQISSGPMSLVRVSKLQRDASVPMIRQRANAI
ncbi:MAG: S-adenosyl-l-methionine hydroxide adenosyltransferase family protein [Pseudomonadota bacterium]